MNKQFLEQYASAWNAHDIETIMSFMTADCVFETGGGKEQHGTRYEGFDVVRERFIEVWTDIPDVRFKSIVHFAEGESGCSEWTLTGTRKDGSAIEVDGCDIFTFENGKIRSKRSYLKNRQA
jgi:ketosteroid isomerase-like protein